MLGTGAGSMSAVWGLTSQPNWQEHYEIDVYQLGWRAGGKGAAGRNRALGDRIEEHGLHMWFGFYQNAFAMIREAYEEVQKLGPYGYKSWREAFTPRNDLFLQEYIEGAWQSWHTTFPANHETPGDGKPMQSIASMIREAIEWGIELLFGADVLDWLEANFRPFEPTPESTSLIERVMQRVEGVVSKLWNGVESRFSAALTQHLNDAHRLAHAASLEEDALEILLGLLTNILRWLGAALEGELDRHTEIRRAYILVDLGASLLRGLLDDGCLKAKSFDPIEQYDWLKWLEKNGASKLCLASPWVRGLYDGPFAFMRGDASCPSMSAAVAVRGQMRGFLGYKGAPMWMMNAGMGDTVFSPVYLVLKARGVRFHFFHRVRELQFDSALTTIEGVRIGVQATTKGGADYNPTFPLHGIQCWPSTPDFTQLVQGDELIARNIDLESSWSGWEDVSEKQLKRGVDFDILISGLSLAVWPIVAPALFQGTSATAMKWQTLVQNIPAIPTQSVQLWLNKSAHELGWKGNAGFVGAYAQPFDTWCDFSGLLPAENWPADGPKALIYLCGPLRSPRVYPPASDTSFPGHQKERVHDGGADWLSANGGFPWPSAAPINEPASLDPNVLYDTENRQGWERLRGQYVRANIEPSERYVLSPPGTAGMRLRATESGIDGLLLAGDWLSTGLQSGCVEAAAMGGLQASQAICGYPKEIPGDNDTWGSPEETE